MTRLLHDFFMRRLSVRGLARKYKLTIKQVESRIRREMRRKR